MKKSLVSLTWSELEYEICEKFGFQHKGFKLWTCYLFGKWCCESQGNLEVNGIEYKFDTERMTLDKVA